MEKYVLLFGFIFFFYYGKAQSSSNIDFETGGFAGWQGTYDNTTCGTSTPNPMTISGVGSPQQTIVSIGFDPSVTLASLLVNSPFGGSYSARLGDTIDGCGAASIRHTFTPTPLGGYFLSFSYALIFNDNGSHAFSDAPKFIYYFFDATGNCCVYPSGVTYCDTIVFTPSDTSFHHGSNNPNGIYYTKWKQLCFDLSPYLGQTITVEFTTSDCDSGTHRGYAYVDCQINTSSCSSTTSINKITDLSPSVSVYPNPANNYINLTLKSLQADEFEITLCDITGNTLIKDNFASALGQINKTYKTENLPRGIYFVYIKTKQQGTLQKKVIIN